MYHDAFVHSLVMCALLVPRAFSLFVALSPVSRCHVPSRVGVDHHRISVLSSLVDLMSAPMELEPKRFAWFRVFQALY
jgi:hypothetical protein